MKTVKPIRERPSLSILCEMYEACKEPNGLAGYYGTFGTKACEEYNQACCDLGDRIHTCLELHELGKHTTPDACDIKDPREKFMAGLIKQWIRETGMQAVPTTLTETGKAIEVKLDSTVLDYSCRADRVVTFGSDPTKWIGDYKTSASLKDSYKLQLAGYAWGWYERTGEWIDQGFLLRVEKKPKAKQQLEVLEVHNLSAWIDPLCQLRGLWDFINKKKEWKTLT